MVAQAPVVLQRVFRQIPRPQETEQQLPCSEHDAPAGLHDDAMQRVLQVCPGQHSKVCPQVWPVVRHTVGRQNPFVHPSPVQHSEETTQAPPGPRQVDGRQVPPAQTPEQHSL